MERVEALLNRYFEGETSLEEERTLKEFFRSTQVVPSQWEGYRTIFGYFDSERAIVSDRATASSNRHRIWRILWLSTAAAAACIGFAVLYQMDNTGLTPAAGRVAQVVKIKQVEEVSRIAPPHKNVAPAKGHRFKKIALPMENEQKSEPVKPSSEKKTIDALEEMDGVENSLRKLKVIREANSSLSPLSNLAYLEEYFPKEKSNN
jgi:hypothetical protein